jgi:hypothetical protein
MCQEEATICHYRRDSIRSPWNRKDNGAHGMLILSFPEGDSASPRGKFDYLSVCQIVQYFPGVICHPPPALLIPPAEKTVWSMSRTVISPKGIH